MEAGHAGDVGMGDHAAGGDGTGGGDGRGGRKRRSFPRLRRLFREITGAADDELVQALVRQIDTARAGANLARMAITGEVDLTAARRAMGRIEHEGDAYRADLINKLSTALMPPFDREDLFRLSRSIDDVLDNLRDFVREADLLGVTSDDHFSEMLLALHEGLEHLTIAVKGISATPSEVTRKALEAKKAGNRIRKSYQIAIARVLDGEVTMTALKVRELLRRVDHIGLRLGEAADALADGATKRSL